MEKKQKSKSHRQRKREKSRDQGKELRTDLVYKGEGLPADVVYEILSHYRVHSRQDPLLLITKKKIDKTNRTNVLRFYMHNINEETLVSKFSKTLPPLPYGIDLLLLQTCQGFLCFVDDCYKTYIFLCNPSTRELIALPPTNEANDCVAFGFTESTKELKVVRFFRRKLLGGTKSLCQVFTLNTREWIEAKCPPQNQNFLPRAYFLHGAIHLEPHGMGPIYAFSIETEEYRLISLPEICDSPVMEYMPHFSELGGFLCLTMYIDRRCEIWLLKEYNNGMWMKEYTIDHPNLGIPSAISADGSLLLQTSGGSKGSDGWLSFYNPRDGTYTRKLVYLPGGKTTLYVGSLFALCR